MPITPCTSPKRTGRPMTTRGSTPPTKPNFSMPSSVIFLIITPTSSMWAHSTTGRSSAFLPFRNTIMLPMASVFISSANGFTFSSTNSRTASSQPDGPGSAHSCFISSIMRPPPRQIRAGILPSDQRLPARQTALRPRPAYACIFPEWTADPLRCRGRRSASSTHSCRCCPP